MPVGEVKGFTIGPNRDGTKNVLLLEVEITDPDDRQTVELYTQAGEDSNPPAGSKVFVVMSGEAWKIAVAAEDGIAPSVGPGEKEFYSSADGAKKATLLFQVNGQLIAQGGGDNAVRFSKLEEAFNQLRDDHNDLLAHYNGHTHTTPAGASGTPVVPPPLPTPSTADVSPAKVDNIEVP